MRVYDEVLGMEVEIQEEVTPENGKEIIIEDPQEIRDEMQSA